MADGTRADGTRADGALRTRGALLDAGAALAEEHGLAGVSVNMVTARAGVAKGTFYVHFKDRAAFVDAMHARFHARVQAAVDQAVAGLPPGARRLSRAREQGGQGTVTRGSLGPGGTGLDGSPARASDSGGRGLDEVGGVEGGERPRVGGKV